MYLRTKMTHLIVLFLMLVLALALGCQKKAEEIPLDMPEETTGEIPMPVVPSKIMVPEDVAGKWKAVVLEVTDKDTSERTDFTLNIGETAPLGSTGLSIFVEAFLPSFQMAGDVFTSSSPDLNNPAVKARITDSTGAELFNRWLFSLYPATHPFDHPRYAIILKDYVANE
jgi:hypothetical protein